MEIQNRKGYTVSTALHTWKQNQPEKLPLLSLPEEISVTKLSCRRDDFVIPTTG